MALAGIQVEFGFAGVGVGAKQEIAGTLLQKPVWSENIAAPGTSALAATRGRDGTTTTQGQPIMRIFAVADVYVAFGAAPNASNSPRALIKAGTELIRGVDVGDKVAYIAVP